MLTSARLTLKQHRFEVGGAVLGAFLLGVLALVVDARLRAINVPAGCFDVWLSAGPEGAGDCTAPVKAFAAINEEEAGKILAAMAVLPFALGLLAGVPIVGRELESRTAQTAWSLTASRLRWLLRQLAPILTLLGVAITFAALAANVLETTREPWNHSGFSDIELHGPPVVGRALGALGVGLLLGALLGRTLPAFIVGALLSILLVMGAGIARSAWLDTQKTVIPVDSSTGQPADPYALTFGQGWLTPEGAQIEDEESFARVPSGESDPNAWLRDQGYKQFIVGVREEVAMGWAPYEALGFGLVGMASFVAGIVVVNRRRPT